MKTWKVIRIYKLPAGSKAEALRLIHREGAEENYFAAEFAVEETPPGFWRQLVKQLLG